jgi:DNA/RNA-binding domain of Phe-tRNA-synthetase-like protein
MASFTYHPEIVQRYPNLAGGVIIAKNINNQITPDEFLTEYSAEQSAVKNRIGETPLSQLSSISAWRSTFSSFGVEPTKYRSAPEAFLRRLTKKGDIPNINLLVDIGNLISIRYALPVCVIDAKALAGESVLVRFATGSEPFTPLKGGEVENPEPGEVIFVDSDNVIMARRWCWRQSEQSSAQPETTETILVMEAQHKGGSADISAALADFTSLLTKYTGGTFTSNILTGEQNSVSA